MNAIDLYLRVREKEGRLYSDDVTARLPDIAPDHPLAREWRARAGSCARLVRHLKTISTPLHILDVGCGNGWLSRKLSLIRGARVFAVDRSSPELTQAARLFNGANLVFVDADVFRAPFRYPSFNVIILASVIQYFPNLPALLGALKALLLQNGEIHVLDSPLYEPDEISAARERTRAYYASLGFPEMDEYYFHHSVRALSGFSLRWLHRPDGFRARSSRSFGWTVSPFPWISIR